MREIKYIAVHCTAGSQRQTAEGIVYYHTGPKEKGCLGWNAPGYHYIIDPEGRVHAVWPEERVSNGVKGWNSVSINVAWIGGVDTTTKALTPIDNRTPAQKAALRTLVADIHRRHPSAKIQGHRDFPKVAKACPCFNAIEEYKDI